MNKLSIFSKTVGALATLAVLAVGFSALAPSVVEAGCICAPYVRSTTGWAGGSTCAAATSACYNDALANANAICNYEEVTSVCAVVSFSTRNNCPEPSSPYTTDCDMEFRCYACPFG